MEKENTKYQNVETLTKLLRTATSALQKFNKKVTNIVNGKREISSNNVDTVEYGVLALEDLLLNSTSKNDIDPLSFRHYIIKRMFYYEYEDFKECLTAFYRGCPEDILSNSIFYKRQNEHDIPPKNNPVRFSMIKPRHSKLETEKRKVAQLTYNIDKKLECLNIFEKMNDDERLLLINKEYDKFLTNRQHIIDDFESKCHKKQGSILGEITQQTWEELYHEVTNEWRNKVENEQQMDVCHYSLVEIVLNNNKEHRVQQFAELNDAYYMEDSDCLSYNDYKKSFRCFFEINYIKQQILTANNSYAEKIDNEILNQYNDCEKYMLEQMNLAEKPKQQLVYYKAAINVGAIPLMACDQFEKKYNFKFTSSTYSRWINSKNEEYQSSEIEPIERIYKSIMNNNAKSTLQKE